MLDAGIKTQLKAYFDRIVHPITLQASLGDGAKSLEMRELLEVLANGPLGGGNDPGVDAQQVIMTRPAPRPGRSTYGPRARHNS